jgi:hypothetical protein
VYDFTPEEPAGLHYYSLPMEIDHYSFGLAERLTQGELEDMGKQGYGSLFNRESKTLPSETICRGPLPFTCKACTYR